MRIPRHRALAPLGLALSALIAAGSGCSDGICTGDGSCAYNSESSRDGNLTAGKGARVNTAAPEREGERELAGGPK